MTKYVTTDTPNTLFAVDDDGGKIKGIVSNNGEFSGVTPHYPSKAAMPLPTSNDGRPWQCQVGGTVYKTDGVNPWVKSGEPRVTTWAERGLAADHEGELVEISDRNHLGFFTATDLISSNNLNEIHVYVSSAKSATANTTAINAALALKGTIRVRGSGIALINETLVADDDTTFIIDEGLTLKMDAGLHRNIISTTGIVNKATTGTIVTIAWTQGLRATVSWTAHGKAIGDYVWLEGADQHEYNIVARIQTVVGVDSFTIMLDRNPTATATGTITARTPNKNIKLEVNGVLDYDRLTKSGTFGSNISLLAVVLSGVNIEVSRVNSIINVPKYCLCFGAVRNFKAFNLNFGPTNSDGLKIYGPAYGGIIDGAGGYTGDDFVSIQPIEPSGFIDYMWSSGDITNIKVQNLTPNDTSAAATLTIYPSESGEYVDNIIIENVDIFNRILLSRGTFTAESFIGLVTIRNVKAPDDALQATGSIKINTGVNVKHLIVEGCSGSLRPKSWIDVIATSTVQKMTLRDINLKVEANYVVNNAGTINSLSLEDSDITGLGVGGKIFNNSGTLRKLTVKNNTLSTIAYLLQQSAGAVAGSKITIENNLIVSALVAAGLVSLIEDATVIFKKNIVTLGNKGLVTINGAGKVVKVYTEANDYSYLAGGVLFVNTGGTSEIALFGTDIPAVLSELTRTIPGQIVQAKTALGTILANETVINDTTNAVGSWHQLSNPALVY